MPKLRSMGRFLFWAVWIFAGGCAGSGADLPPRVLSGIDGKEMVLIPRGEFLMGTDRTDPENTHLRIGTVKPLFRDQQPRHAVYLDAYYIDKYEVTNAEYQQFLRATLYPDTPPHWTGENFPEGTGNWPVTNIRWQEATAYALWAGKALPTEAQWEKAARGTDGRLYPWGGEYIKGIANMGLDGLKEPAPVGTYPGDVSPYQVYDMAGNVMEWTRSWYEPYAGSDYRHPKMGRLLKVLRGNGFQKGGHFFLEAFRYVFHRTETSPDKHFENVGFRCVLPAPEKV
ncbi:MAG: formylglycine-generating enzyme family protein [Nitrospinaceae bacterium]